MKEINIGKTLVMKRKEKGITQDELAVYIGVSKASVSKWETGQSYPDITFLPQLAAYFNISVDELLGYEPQMTKEDIRKLYYRLTGEFASKPFYEVLGECHEIIKKYYSCFPLLLQMAVLLTNHYMLAGEKKEQEAVLNDAVEVCRRVRSESNEMHILKEANSVEAVCLLLLEKPEEVFELLDSTLKPLPSDYTILANAYQMKGNISKAKQVLQIGMYNGLFNYMGIVPAYLLLNYDNADKYETILQRVICIVDIFEINKLHPGVMVQIYLAAAQGYVLQGNNEKAIDMISKYADLCISDAFPYELHGDSFFDSLDSWFEDFDLGKQMPRDQKVVYASMLQVISNNPMFEALKDNPRYKSIIEKMKTKLGGKI